MLDYIFEIAICVLASAFLMIIHEFTKAVTYMLMQRKNGVKREYIHKIWEVHRFVDPIGLILAVTSSVSLSKPYMFRLQSKKYNLILGIVGFFTLILCFFCSMLALKCHFMGARGMVTLDSDDLIAKYVVLFIQYVAILSLGMFVVNLFPVSTFDMGLIIAGFSFKKYMNIIKMDGVIKVILILTVLIDIIQYGCYRFITFLL